MTAWLVRHLQTSIGSLGRLAQHKLATTLTILVIGIALALPACLHLLVTNAQTATGNWNRAVDLTVFLKRPTSAEEARRTAERIRQRRDVAEAQLILADEALKEFRRDSGFGDAIDALNENPLPHTIVIRPAPTYTNTANLQSLAADVRALPSVEAVQLDTAWVSRLNAILEAFQRGLLLAAAVLGLGVMVIVGNTIRLDIQHRRDEIEVTKLVGGKRRLRASAVPLQRLLVRPGRGRYGLGDHPHRPRCSSRPHRAPGRALRQQFSARSPGSRGLGPPVRRRHCARLAGVLYRRHPASSQDRADLI